MVMPGVLLLVDAAEGCMPQTRFVLQKALQQNLSLVVAINKIDRPDARIKEVIDEVLYLLMDLGATDEQLECPMLVLRRDGTASLDPDVPGTDLIPLFDTLLSTIKPPEGDPEAPFQMLVSSVDYNEFVGRIGIGRIQNGVAKVGEEVVVCDWHNPDLKMRGRLTKLYDFQANGRQPCDNITAGDMRGLLRPAGCDHRQHPVQPRSDRAAALRQDQRPHRGDDLLGQRQPAGWAARASTSPAVRSATVCRRSC